MLKTERPELRYLRWSLVAVWLLTALVSLLEWNGQSRELLTAWGSGRDAWKSAAIGSGAMLDLLLGLALWFRPGRAVYWICLVMVLTMTVMASVWAPEQWLHPLGPLSKNLPILAILWLLIRHTDQVRDIP
ncbi:DoxX-like family protein [Hydrogenophaga sp. 5NK40-0174]|uniref:DoxX-like family protein n=1 Tax=Hydrogenophaga sp. 5NK40-0174 TaxID=3127649 RepID=UPI003107EEA6